MKLYYTLFIISAIISSSNAQTKSHTSVAFAPHSRVDVYYPDGAFRTRGSVVQVLNNSYKIHFDGCPAGDDKVFDKALVKQPDAISATDADITSLTGKWIFFTPSYPSSHDEQRKMLNEYLSGAKEPPLLINSDGTFIWYYQFGKPPYNGKWIIDAKVPGQTHGAQSFNGIILIDPDSHYYKLHTDQNGHLIADQLCMGNTFMGSRIMSR